MKRKGIEIFVAILLGIIIPSLLITVLQDRIINNKSTAGVTNSTSDITEAKRNITVLFGDNTIIEMPLEKYVISVVLTEMPADFELEALKAQAVVARTYALRRTVKNKKHPGAAVCINSSCCQGYCDVDDYLKEGGKQSSVDKIEDAVHATEGLVLVYDNELIDATYFSCSGGATEDAAAVWGTAVPYLQSVESPGEEGARHYVDTVQFSLTEFIKKLELEEVAVSDIKLGKITYTNGGGVESLQISNKYFSGTELRKRLKLRSTAFLISVLGETVTITTKGFGHRVGMSQYGADAMAVNGAAFQDILAHYYQGTQLIPYDLN